MDSAEIYVNSRLPVGHSSDPSKYEKVPRAARDRMSLMIRAGAVLVVLCALIILTGDGWMLRRKKPGMLTRSPPPGVRGRMKGSIVAPEAPRSTEELWDSPAEPEPQEAMQPEAAPQPPPPPAAPQCKPVEDDIDPTRALAKPKQKPAAPKSTSSLWNPEEPQTCGGYFGNGYSEDHVLVPDVGGDAQLPLLHCRSHPQTQAVFCEARNVIFHPQRMSMSRGGEALEAVMGRDEEQEMPHYSDGAVEIVRTGYGNLRMEAPAGAGVPAPALDVAGETLGQFTGSPLAGLLDRNDSPKLRLLRSLRIIDVPASATAPGARTCRTRITQPVMMVTRVEYANLFHQSTDWYNVWSVARVLGVEPTTDYEAEGLHADSLLPPNPGDPKIPYHVVFLDGHNASPMDDGWLGLFLSVTYIQHFGADVCFDSVVLAPYGYSAAVSKGIMPLQTKCPNEPHVRQFGEDMVRGLGLTPRAVATCAEDTTNVLFVRRVHYLAHPRHNGKVVRRLDNEDDIVNSLEKVVADTHESGIKLLNGLFSNMNMKEQVQMAQDSCVIVGAHGAGLSHILFAPPGVHMLELQPPAFQRPHFIAYSTWAGAHHHIWLLDSSEPAVSLVITRILENAQHGAKEAREQLQLGR